MFQSSTTICKKDAYCWKGWRPNKKKKIFKPSKIEKISRLIVSLPLYQEQTPSLSVKTLIKPKTIVVIDGQII